MARLATTTTNKFVPNEEVNAYLEAALNGNTMEVSTMLNRRWYMVDVPSENEETALMLATWNGNLETVNMLCQHNASTFTTNEDDENVFDQVCDKDKKIQKQMEQLLQKARNDEIDSWNVGEYETNRVVYQRDADNGGVWCTYKSDFSCDFEDSEGMDDEMTRSGFEMITSC